MIAPDIAPSEDTTPSKIVLRSSIFRKEREMSWLELEDYLARAEKKGIAALGPDELQRLPLLYRSVLSSLSVARAIALDRNLLLYLENLSLRGFLVVYGPRHSFAPSAVSFFTRDFPAAVRLVRYHIAIAALVMLAGVAAGYLLMASDEDWFSSLVPGQLAGGRGPHSTRQDLLSHEIFAPWPGMVDAFAKMANFLFSHNTVVGLLAFSTGLAAGVPTLVLIAYQGIILGAFLEFHVKQGLGVEFLGWIAIHGVTELSAIVLCGAAGLLIADKILFPDRYSRMQSLSMHGRIAAQIATGAVLLFFVAAILEGGFRQLVASTGWRFVIGAVSGVVWFSYFALAGKRKPS
jgi:uncharacterized membrane protein SpoIIM required for sporulation